MIIRNYKTEDCRYLSDLFYDTVHTINAADYTKEQLCAWATGNVDLEAWNRSFLEHVTVVAQEGTVITGFGDISESGYLDRLYVHKDYQGRGIATAICSELEDRIPADIITTHASITARPFFERRGYRVLRQQTVERYGVCMENYIMQKDSGL